MKLVAGVLGFLLAMSPLNKSAAESTLLKPGDNWIEVRTTNFRFFSNAGRQTTRSIAVDLEELRAVLSQLTDYELQSPLQTYIYVFKGRRSFLPFKILYDGRPADVSGYFFANEEANFIAINADTPDDSALIYHEYVHYVANNNLWYLPVWFSEGLAEFYESFHVSGNRVTIGLPVARHLILLRNSTLIPLQRLFAVDRMSELYNETDRKNVFYAESWALVHYLLLGSEERRSQVATYLESIRNGAPSDEAFAEAFSSDYETLMRELRAYIRSLRLPSIELQAKIDLDKSLEVRKMSRAETFHRLGELLASQHPDRPERRAYFEAALELDPHYGPVLSSLAIEAEKAADWEVARGLHQRAFAASPEDALVAFRWGQFLSRRGEGFEHAVDVLTRSTELDPSFAPAWASLSEVYADAGITSPEAVEAARVALIMRPSDIAAARDLIRLYLRLDRRQEAVSLTERFLRSDRETQKKMWMLVIQHDVLRARESLQKGQPDAAVERIELSEQLIERSLNPGMARLSLDSARRAVTEYRAASLYNHAQELFSNDDREGARELIEAALELVDEGPIAFSCRRLLAQINAPERPNEAASISTFSPSPTAAEIDELNRLIVAREFTAAIDFLEEMRTRVGGEQQEWLDGRIREIRRTLDYNRFVDEYNRAIDAYNQRRYGETVDILEALIATLGEGRELDSAQALLEDTRAAMK
ncbi:MAG: DUF1570 domain-containing protein [Acidobacteria bacterium]|nr:DUF1570 domain-containing protein [Acidobacteriota bacterium]